MKNILKENIKFFTIILLAVIAMILTSAHFLKVNNKVFTYDDIAERQEYYDDFNEGDYLEQKIISKENNFSKLKVFFKVLDNSIGNAKIQLIDENNNIIKEAEIAKNHLHPYYELEFNAQKDSENKEYTIKINFEKKAESRKFFGVETTENNELAKYRINGEESNKSLVFQEFYYKPHKMLIYVLATIILVISLVAISCYIYFKKSIKPEKIFLITIPIIGLFYIIAMPTYKNHDELYHWYRGYEVSIGAWNETANEEVMGTMMPESVANFMGKLPMKVQYADFKEGINSKIDNDNLIRIYSETQAVYSFVSYIPQALGMFLARIVTNSTMIVAYAGRLMNLLFSIAMLYFAIKHIPFGKNILLLIAYMPIALEGFTSLSADALTMAISLLYIAEILRYAYSKKDHIIGGKQIATLTVMSIVVALCKIVYIPLVLLLFIIPKSKFKNDKKAFKVIAIIAISVIINLLWLKQASSYLTYFRDGDSKYQVMNILTNPIQYIQVVLYTLNSKITTYYYEMFGCNIGWEEFVHLNYLVAFILGIVLIGIVVADNNMKVKLNRWVQLVIAFVSLSIIALIFTSLYVQWTPVNNSEILGIQGRYFIPILPLVAILISCNLTKLKSQYKTENISKFVGIIGTMVQIFAILQIVVFNV